MVKKCNKVANVRGKNVTAVVSFDTVAKIRVGYMFILT